MVTVFFFDFVWGKPRPRFMKNGHAYKTKDTSDKLKKIADAYRDASESSHHGHVAKAPAGVPVTVAIRTQRPIPQSRPKRILREFDLVKPDMDNIAKGVLDALNGIAWTDDKQVREIYAYKSDRMRDVPERTFVLVMWEGNNYELE